MLSNLEKYESTQEKIATTKSQKTQHKDLCSTSKKKKLKKISLHEALGKPVNTPLTSKDLFAIELIKFCPRYIASAMRQQIPLFASTFRKPDLRVILMQIAISEFQTYRNNPCTASPYSILSKYNELVDLANKHLPGDEIAKIKFDANALKESTHSTYASYLAKLETLGLQYSAKGRDERHIYRINEAILFRLFPSAVRSAAVMTERFESTLNIEKKVAFLRAKFEIKKLTSKNCDKKLGLQRGGASIHPPSPINTGFSENFQEKNSDYPYNSIPKDQDQKIKRSIGLAAIKGLSVDKKLKQEFHDLAWKKYFENPEDFDKSTARVVKECVWYGIRAYKADFGEKHKIFNKDRAEQIITACHGAGVEIKEFYKSFLEKTCKYDKKVQWQSRASNFKARAFEEQNKPKPQVSLPSDHKVMSSFVGMMSSLQPSYSTNSTDLEFQLTEDELNRAPDFPEYFDPSKVGHTYTLEEEDITRDYLPNVEQQQADSSQETKISLKDMFGKGESVKSILRNLEA